MKVLILMGSENDLTVMKEAAGVLEELGIPYEMTIGSAHRSPARVRRLAAEAEKRGAGVIIAGAGMAAHLAGAVAACTVLPVIGVPLESSALGGLDALLSTAQMPPGVPVATVAVGKAGARNAGWLAAQILAVEDKKLAGELRRRRRALAQDVERKAKQLEKKQ
ncbi:MAG: 5-(carboxyamino)imidazole ribonucleotide mutase [Nitrospirota bacterium]|jgi:phosphoribosylaminoimidazole carboxylase PurE protein